MNQGGVENSGLAADGVNSHFCYAPFTQLLLQPNGKVSPCCYHFGIKLGDLKNGSLMDIWNGSPAQRLRNEFLSGAIRSCKSRIHNLNCYQQFTRFAEGAQLSAYQERPPQRLDVRLNGQCNLSCVMCDVWQQPNRVYDDNSFWTEGPEFIFPHLREIEMLGGEPFIQADTFRLIKEVRSVNPQCIWSFVTNGQYQSHKKVMDALDHLPLRQIQVSIDSLIPEVYRDIRRGGELFIALDSVDKFAALRDRRKSRGDEFRLVLSMCILQQNWRGIPQFLDFCREMDAEPDLQFAFYDPSQQSSLLLLGDEDRRAVIRQTLDAIDECDHDVVSAVLKPIYGSTSVR